MKAGLHHKPRRRASHARAGAFVVDGFRSPRVDDLIVLDFARPSNGLPRVREILSLRALASAAGTSAQDRPRRWKRSGTIRARRRSTPGVISRIPPAKTISPSVIESSRHPPHARRSRHESAPQARQPSRRTSHAPRSPVPITMANVFQPPIQSATYSNIASSMSGHKREE